MGSAGQSGQQQDPGAAWANMSSASPASTPSYSPAATTPAAPQQWDTGAPGSMPSNVPTTSGATGGATFNAASPQYYMQQQVNSMLSNPNYFRNINQGYMNPAAGGMQGIIQNLVDSAQQRGQVYNQQGATQGWDPQAQAQQYAQQIQQQLQQMSSGESDGRTLWDAWQQQLNAPPPSAPMQAQPAPAQIPSGTTPGLMANMQQSTPFAAPPPVAQPAIPAPAVAQAEATRPTTPPLAPQSNIAPNQATLSRLNHLWGQVRGYR